jgi:hypothetical protein
MAWASDAVAWLPEACPPVDGQYPAACPPEGGQYPAVCSPVEACAPEEAGTLEEEAGNEEGAACGRHKRFCVPILGRGHSSCRKQPSRMSSRANRNILTAIISLKARHR